VQYYGQHFASEPNPAHIKFGQRGFIVYLKGDPAGHWHEKQKRPQNCGPLVDARRRRRFQLEVITLPGKSLIDLPQYR
jgi:hypothetical protein